MLNCWFDGSTIDLRCFTVSCWAFVIKNRFSLSVGRSSSKARWSELLPVFLMYGFYRKCQQHNRVSDFSRLKLLWGEHRNDLPAVRWFHHFEWRPEQPWPWIVDYVFFFFTHCQILLDSGLTYSLSHCPVFGDHRRFRSELNNHFILYHQFLWLFS